MQNNWSIQPEPISEEEQNKRDMEWWVMVCKKARVNPSTGPLNREQKRLLDKMIRRNPKK